jgi:outer membrane protein TolC
MRLLPGLAGLVLGLAAYGAVLAQDKPEQSTAQRQPPRTAAREGLDPQLAKLVDDALARNPEIQAAARERDAARQRIRPAGALDDPMLEAGVVNVPVPSWSFRTEDMTMTMLGLSQRLPFPGKRDLRAEAATKEAVVVGFGYRETVNRVAREVRITYLDLALIADTTRIVQQNRLVLEQFLRTAEARYAQGQATQADVFKAQTQLSRMVEELVRLDRERPAMEAELERAVARPLAPDERPVQVPAVQGTSPDFEALMAKAKAMRPQLLALQAEIERGDKMIELARKDYYPDFDLKFAYGLRQAMPDGTPRDNMVTLTVAINLPVWQASKQDPRLAEAIAMRDRARDMLRSQLNEVAAKLRQQVEVARQSVRSASLYRDAILPPARLAVEAALSAYRVARVDFLTLLDSQMAVFNYEIARAQAVTGFHRALAEIDLIVGERVRAREELDEERTGK